MSPCRPNTSNPRSGGRQTAALWLESGMEKTPLDPKQKAPPTPKQACLSILHLPSSHPFRLQLLELLGPDSGWRPADVVGPHARANFGVVPVGAKLRFGIAASVSFFRGVERVQWSVKTWSVAHILGRLAAGFAPSKSARLGATSRRRNCCVPEFAMFNPSCHPSANLSNKLSPFLGKTIQRI